MFIASLGEPCCNGFITVNFSWIAGDNIDETFMFYQSDGVTPLDLTGYEAKMLFGFPTPLNLTTQNGGLIIDAPLTGAVRMVQSSTNSLSNPPGTWPFEFWLIPTTSPLNQAEYFSGSGTVIKSLYTAS